MNRLLITIIFTTYWSSAIAAELLPVDESSKDESFVIFKNELQAAIKRKDSKYLLTIISPDILNSFGGDGGKDEFIEKWNLRSPETSEIWSELAWILNHGGSFSDSTNYCAPYVFSNWPNQYDSFEFYAITEKSVPLLSDKSSQAKVTETLKYSIVKVLDDRVWEKNKSDLVKVKFNSSQGYVQLSTLRSPIDYRACFEKIKNTWVLKSLVAGD